MGSLTDTVPSGRIPVPGPVAARGRRWWAPVTNRRSPTIRGKQLVPITVRASGVGMVSNTVVSQQFSMSRGFVADEVVRCGRGSRDRRANSRGFARGWWAGSTGLCAYGIRSLRNQFGCASFAGLDNRTGCSDGCSICRVSAAECGYGDRLVNFGTITGAALSDGPVLGAVSRNSSRVRSAGAHAVGARIFGKGAVVTAGGGGSHR